MATLVSKSMLLSHQEGTGTGTGTPGVSCIKPGHTVTGDIRFHRTRGFQCHSVAVLKVFSTTRKPKHLHLLRPSRHSSSLRPQPLRGKRDASLTSPPTTHANLPRVGNWSASYFLLQFSFIVQTIIPHT